MVEEIEAELGDEKPRSAADARLHSQLCDDVELLDGAADANSTWKPRARGELSPVFFGSALTNFGVEPFLKEFLRLTTTAAGPRDSRPASVVDPATRHFSAFMFKIQANMNKAHRDRIAFMRICSGKFERGMEAFHVQEGKNIKLAQPAPADGAGPRDRGRSLRGRHHRPVRPGHLLHRRHAVHRQAEAVQLRGHPHLRARALCPREQVDTMKRKQFVKGMEQIAQEGAIQIFREPGGGMEEVIVGVVGVLQFEVLEYRDRLYCKTQPRPGAGRNGAVSCAKGGITNDRTYNGKF
jgi:peptide chain release factor 3